MTQRIQKIAIIGVGLIGGSIGLCLKKRYGPKISIFGSCNDRKRSILARNKGYIDHIIEKLELIPQDIQLVIIAAPLHTSITILDTLVRLNSKKRIIIDVDSTKTAICDKAELLLSDKPKNLAFIGTHPMAGSETSGFEHADCNLFRNKPWILCPSADAKRQEINRVENFIRILGARPIQMDAKIHDKLAAQVSHAFLVLGSILIRNVSNRHEWKTMAPIASTGFCDITRLASHNPAFKSEIIEMNKENVINSLKDIKREINIFIDLCSHKSSVGIHSYFMRAKKIRDRWLSDYSY